MLFNSHFFIFVFLPVTFAGFFVLARFSAIAAAAWLAGASIAFYAWWNPVYVWLLAGSICFNYLMGVLIARYAGSGDRAASKRVLIVAVTTNLLALVYFKYANFFLSSTDALLGTHHTLGEIVLPLGISFFTFTQIAFLADSYIGKAREYNFVHYTLFVTYFPHLIAGPVLHHSEMMPQFREPRTYRMNFDYIAAGLAFFALGLAKKVLIADRLSAFVSPVFTAAAEGVPLTLAQAWGGALAYTGQLYFDFSGYSDMAIGLSLLFGIVLPLNFFSPYQATSIIDFWRRWHMTLSRFLRDYLYIPLGGNRGGTARRYLNLMITMVLGGLWHGAGWTFVFWGFLHGCFLAVNHAWRYLSVRVLGVRESSAFGRFCAWLLTFVCVVVGWVFFRAVDMASAVEILKSMSGLGRGPALASGQPEAVFAMSQWLFLCAALAIALKLPNTFEIVGLPPGAPRFTSGLEPRSTPLRWRATRTWALGTALIFAVCVFEVGGYSEFLYFNF